jgi:predicted MFS family arabinose efflux permease
MCHWGVVMGYLPQRAEAAGADIGLFFTADAVALLAVRVPAGWLAGRIGALPLTLAGTLLTAASLAVLLWPPTTALLVVAGLGTGAGGALLLPTMMIELSGRSDASDRGSAFGLYSVAFGLGIAVGSIGIAPIYPIVGFEAALAVGIGLVLAGGVVAWLDRGMRSAPMGHSTA